MRSLLQRVLLAGLLGLGAGVARAESPPMQALPKLDLAAYEGRWYQVALYPNRFQSQCVSDTTATYARAGDGTISVVNRCRRADGSMDEVTGVARPLRGKSSLRDGALEPAMLEVSFLPAWLRWTGLGWGDYWVLELGPAGRYSIVSEPSRKYLWVLAREPVLTPAEDAAVRERLQALGFDLARLQAHPQSR